MANVIRLKRASGSDPAASDLVSGEPAVRTDTGELFFKKDDGSIAKVAGAGGGPDFKYLALRNAANNGAASFPNADFTLVTSGTTSAITPTAANTLLVSVNGVIQKPNTGTSTPSSGFALSGSTIKFGANLSAAPDFILYQESGGIGEPSDETVSEEKLKVSNSPVNGYFLSAQSGNTGGLTWAAPVATSCTGNSATATALATARTINGTSFDGTANITVTAAAGTLTGNTLNSSVTASSLTSLGDLSGLTVTGNLAVDTSTLFVNASTNRTGVGTTNPLHKLEVENGTDQENIIVARGADASTEYAGMGVHGGNAIFTGGGVGSTSAGMVFRTAASGNEQERMRITSNGKVNIGTGSLDQTDRMLNVYGGRVRIEGISSGNSFEILNSASTGQSHGILCQAGTNSSDVNSTFRNTSGSTLLRIRGDGNVGIGTTSPTQKLVVSGTGSQYVAVTSTDSDNTGVLFGDSDIDAGFVLYANSDDSLRFGAGAGNERMRINSSGQLIQRYSADPYDNRAATFQSPSGVSATYISIINTETNGQSGITFGDHAGQNAGNFDGYINYDHSNQSMTFLVNGGTERMRIVNDGRIGIGTNSPDQTLHLHKGSAGSISSASNSVLTLENSTDAILQFLTPSNKVNQIRFGDPSDNGAGYIDYNHNTNVLSFGTAGPEKMRIDSSGRVLVGTTTEGHDNADDLTVASSADTGITIRSGTSSSGNIYFSDATSGNGEFDGYLSYSQSVNKMFFGVNQANRMAIDSSGQVGMGTTSPAQQAGRGLHIHGTDQTRIKLTNSTSNATANDGFDIIQESDMDIHIINHENMAMKFGTNATERMRISSSGNVGIGNRTGSPDELLHVHTSSGEAKIHVEAATNARVRIRAHSGESIVQFADAASSNPGEINYAHSSNQMTFRTNGSVRTTINSDGHVLPASNNTYDLGSSSYRWRNVYTSDLNMSNEGSSNDVDATWGSYTIQEGAEDLFLINRRNGKKYKFNLTEVS